MSPATPLPPWRLALNERQEQAARRGNQGTAGRLALVDILRRAGAQADLVRVRGWTPAECAQAHRWALAFLSGREDLPLPLFLEWQRNDEWRQTRRERWGK